MTFPCFITFQLPAPVVAFFNSRRLNLHGSAEICFGERYLRHPLSVAKVEQGRMRATNVASPAPLLPTAEFDCFRHSFIQLSLSASLVIINITLSFPIYCLVISCLFPLIDFIIFKNRVVSTPKVPMYVIS